MLTQPTKYEVKVLREINGEIQPDLVSGAAVWEAAAALKSRGLADGFYHITQAGKDFLATLETSS